MSNGSSRFRRLALVHAAMMAGETAMVIALADSFFFDVDLTAARSRILLFLVVSFAPFLIISPLIGPLIDRLRGGRRLVIQAVALIRTVLQLAMIALIDTLVLFPLVFVALVLQKSYVVSKSALVPSVVRSEPELVEANSKLGVIAGLAGAVAVVPALAMQWLFSSGVTLAYGALIFAAALIAATKLPREVVVTKSSTGSVRIRPLTERVRLGALLMMLLRALSGFVLFQLAFWFRTIDVATIWFGLVVVASSGGTMVGNLAAPRLRAQLAESKMLLAALAMCSGAGVVTAIVAGPLAGVLLAAVVGLATATGRLAFESMVQRDTPVVNRGRSFARFETRFQLAWVAAAIIPVLLPLPGPVGFFVVAAASLVGLVLAHQSGFVTVAERTPGLTRR
jgi:hypothetical protein